MRFWVGVTDNAWYSFLSSRNFEEINFWQPSAKPPFVNAVPGMPFLFKLKRPNHAIAGGGFFVTYSSLPTAIAWEVFGEKNGAGSLEELQAMLGPLSGGKGYAQEIGCTVLANPFFLPHQLWLRDPPGWASNIVRGKMYDTVDSDGSAIWEAMQWPLAVPLPGAVLEAPGSLGEFGERYGDPILVKPRLGQSSFRVMVTDAYRRRCALTGESTLAALEAAHIVPYSREGTHEVSNGLLLRADFHRLFDAGLVSVDQDLRIRVSPRIREAWFNGKAYYRLNEQPLAVLPALAANQPDRDRLSWHFQNKFQE